jgi:alpha-ribazole phosphatase/probable phosphoglycerate mutase
MVEFYIVRHGSTESNKRKIYMGSSGEGLAPEGRGQADAVVRSLKPLGIRHIYTSPLRRAIETSEMINQYLNVPISIEEDLTEMKLGAWMGLTEGEVSKRFPHDYQLWNSKPGDLVLPGRETLAEVRSRALKAIHRMRESSGEFSVLVVTHVALVRCLIIHFQVLDINIYRRIDVPNASVFRLQWDEKSAQVSRFL